MHRCATHLSFGMDARVLSSVRHPRLCRETAKGLTYAVGGDGIEPVRDLVEHMCSACLFENETKLKCFCGFSAAKRLTLLSPLWGGSPINSQPCSGGV